MHVFVTDKIWDYGSGVQVYVSKVEKGAPIKNVLVMTCMRFSKNGEFCYVYINI